MSGLKAKAGLLFFVSAGIFIGLVVFGNTAASRIRRPAPEENAVSANQTANSLENAIGTEAALPDAAETGSVPTQTAEASGSTNLTRSLASLIGKNIVNKNPEGPAGDSLTVMGADALADSAITESLTRFNPAYFSPEISVSEMTVDNAQTTAEYRAAAEKIISDTESLPMPAAGTPVAEKMKTLAKRYGDEAAALRALPVPQALATEHLKAIRIAEGRRRILEAVADYENDPIYAMLALKLWDTLQ